MNIYLVRRSDGIDYDQYTGFICYAKDESEARNTMPDEQASKSEWAKDLSTLIITKIGQGKCPDKKRRVIFTDYLRG